MIHNALARRRPPAGYLFWSFVFWYQLIRGFVEETFRANPLYAWGYVNEVWGVGFFTLTHLITPAILVLAWWMRRRTLAQAGAQAPESGCRRRPRRGGVRPVYPVSRPLGPSGLSTISRASSR